MSITNVQKTALNTIIDQFPTKIQACIMSIEFLKGQCQKTNIFGYFFIFGLRVFKSLRQIAYQNKCKLISKEFNRK